MRAAGQDWQAGKVSGTVYSGDEKLTQIMAKVGLVFPIRLHALFCLKANNTNIKREPQCVCVCVCSVWCVCVWCVCVHVYVCGFGFSLGWVFSICPSNR